MKDDASLVEAGCGLIFVAVFVSIVVALMMVINGFVLMNYWGWFVVPFFGVPAMGLWQAAGISMMVHFMTHKGARAAGKDTAESMKIVAWSFAYPLVALGLGKIITLLM